MKKSFPFPRRENKVDKYYGYVLIPHVWKKIYENIYQPVYKRQLKGTAPFITVPEPWVMDRYSDVNKVMKSVRFTYRISTRTARPHSRVFVNTVHMYEELMDFDQILYSFQDWHNWAIIRTTPGRDLIFSVVRDKENLKNFRGKDHINGKEYFSCSRSGIRDMLESAEDLNFLGKVIRMSSFNIPGRI